MKYRIVLGWCYMDEGNESCAKDGRVQPAAKYFEPIARIQHTHSVVAAIITLFLVVAVFEDIVMNVFVASNQQIGRSWDN